ncbi:uncharacterized protein [Diadema antillarum]|uniref:uncharacterized protein n=1 Tax=Diadema antillarum TaxID=105358 RepID=UPI003A8B8D29
MAKNAGDTAGNNCSSSIGEENGTRVFLWCSPRTVSTALSKCLSFIEGMEVWSEPFVYCFLSSKELQAATGQEIPMELEGNEAIFAKTTELMRKMTNSNVITERIVFSKLKPRLESSKSKHVFVKDMCFALNEKTLRYLPDGYRHTFLIRTPERTIQSFRKAYFDHFMSQGLLSGTAADEKTFDLLEDCKHMDSGYYIKDVYDFWKYVREEIEPDPIVIDTDDLLNNPREILQKYCELVGLPFSESLMQWDPSIDICKTWKQCGDDQIIQMQPFYGRAMRSSCFMPPTKQVPRDKLTPDVIKGIDETMKYFEEMYEHRITV